MKNKLQPTRTSFPRNFQCKKAPRWLSNFFHFGTENGADQLKKPPCINKFKFWSNSVNQFRGIRSRSTSAKKIRKWGEGTPIPQKKQRYFWVKRTVSMLRDCWSILCPIWFIFKPHLIQNTIYSPCRWLNNRIKHGICTTLSFFLNPEKLFFFNHDGQ